MTCEVFKFPAADRCKQVYEERKAAGTAAMYSYFVITSKSIVPGDLPSTVIINLDAEREKRKF